MAKVKGTVVVNNEPLRRSLSGRRFGTATQRGE